VHRGVKITKRKKRLLRLNFLLLSSYLAALERQPSARV
jgi:hypothetical protein